MLGDGEVHIWLTDPAWAGPQVQAAFVDLLDAPERSRAAGFVFERDRQTYVMARALVRSVLSRHTGVEARALRFVSGARGRPEILPGQNVGAIRFNLSHTRGLVALAVARHRDVGVDVEDIARSLDVLAIAERYFAAPERAALAGLAGPAQRVRFFEHWTLKEAYAKARGEGLWLPFDEFWFELPVEGRPRVRFSPGMTDIADDWCFHLLAPSSGHRGALALRTGAAGPALKLEIWRGVPGPDGQFRGCQPPAGQPWGS